MNCLICNQPTGRRKYCDAHRMQVYRENLQKNAIREGQLRRLNRESLAKARASLHELDTRREPPPPVVEIDAWQPWRKSGIYGHTIAVRPLTIRKIKRGGNHQEHNHDHA